MVNRKHFDRVRGLIDPARVVLGGAADEKALKIEPTIMDKATPRDPVMGEEIFGPVLPVIAFDSLDEAIDLVRSRPTPLALYLFSQDRAAQRRVMREVPFGGGCVNDTIMHLATSHMGFGGMGASGMGSYHGRKRLRDLHAREEHPREGHLRRRPPALPALLPLEVKTRPRVSPLGTRPPARPPRLGLIAAQIWHPLEDIRARRPSLASFRREEPSSGTPF